MVRLASLAKRPITRTRLADKRVPYALSGSTEAATFSCIFAFRSISNFGNLFYSRENLGNIADRKHVLGHSTVPNLGRATSLHEDQIWVQETNQWTRKQPTLFRGAISWMRLLLPPRRLKRP